MKGIPTLSSSIVATLLLVLLALPYEPALARKQSTSDAVMLGRFQGWAIDGQTRELLGIRGEVDIVIELLEYKGHKRLPDMTREAALQSQVLVDITAQLVQAAFQQSAMGAYANSAEALGYLSSALFEAKSKPLAFARFLPPSRPGNKGPPRLLVTLPFRSTSVRFAFVKAKKKPSFSW